MELSVNEALFRVIKLVIYWNLSSSYHRVIKYIFFLSTYYGMWKGLVGSAINAFIIIIIIIFCIEILLIPSQM